MMKHSLIPGGSSGEISCRSRGVATTLADMLLDEDYVVMISREEDLYIVDYIWSQRGADRNDVVFMDRDNFEMDFYETEEEDEDEETNQELINAREKGRQDAECHVWWLAQKLLSLSQDELEEVFQIKDAPDDEYEDFWNRFPDHIPYSVALMMYNNWKAKQDGLLSDEVMDAAMNAWDQMNADQYAGKTEEYCDDI